MGIVPSRNPRRRGSKDPSTRERSRRSWGGRSALFALATGVHAPTMITQSHVHQCPYCELRFEYANEVKDHVIHDHPDHAESFLTVEPHELPHV
jgi:hypothetical protein